MRFATLVSFLVCLQLSLPLLKAETKKTCRFGSRPAQVGDTAEQAINYALNLEMSIEQAGQVIDSKGRNMQRKQQRVIKILEIAEKGVPRKGQLSYGESQTSYELADKEQAIADEVRGKTYVITRQEKDLLITYPDGTMPPETEKQTVRANMSAFGLENPLTSFFNGKTLTVGQTIRLPDDQARNLLGFGSSVGTVSNFLLHLVEVRKFDNKDYAVFDISLDALSPESSNLKMKMTGQIVMRTSDSKVASMTMSGPVGSTEKHGPPTAQFEVVTRGEIKVSLHSKGVIRR